MLNTLDKQQVAKSFGNAAGTYDQVAELQREVGQRLLDYIPPRAYPAVVDLGCGTGYFTSALGERTSASQVWGLDIAEGMIAQARAREANDVRWCCADAEHLPLAESSIDLLFANLVIQWCPDLERVFGEASRVLKPGGRLLISTFGPKSLQELREAWRQVDSYVHVNHFRSLREIAGGVNGSQLNFTSRSESFLYHYPQLRDLTHELKALGAHNLNSGRPQGLTGRAKIRALQSAYERVRDSRAGLPATYEILFLCLDKPRG